MLQPSQLPTYLLFLGFIILLIAIYIAIFRLALQKLINNIQKIPEFTDMEVAVVQHQMLALLVGVPLFLLFLVLSPLGWNLRQPFKFFVVLTIGFAPLAYISMSSIQNRVSIFRGLGSFPVKGTKAVWKGVIYLGFIVLVFIGFAIYFASTK